MSTSRMIDLVFDVRGETLPLSYPFPLWQELIRLVPELAGDEQVGVLPFRGPEVAEQILLPKRAKLVLRLPQALARPAMRISGARLHIPPGFIELGTGKEKAIQPYPTLHAPLMAGDSDEVCFMEWVQAHFQTLGIRAHPICGMRRTLSNGTQTISGYSLVVYGLNPEASLLLQQTGMGGGRRYGCGIFVPYKAISDLQ